MADGLEKHDLSGRIIILRNEMIIPNYSSIWIIYFQMLGILIPNDELTFSRGVGRPPTRWIILYCRASIEKKGSQHISSFFRPNISSGSFCRTGGYGWRQEHLLQCQKVLDEIKVHEETETKVRIVATTVGCHGATVVL